MTSSPLKATTEEPIENKALWVADTSEPAPGATESALDTQVGGDHYKALGDYQPWQVARAWLTDEELKGAAKFTAMGYLAREADKGGRQDIEKAMHTLQIYLELTAPANA